MLPSLLLLHLAVAAVAAYAIDWPTVLDYDTLPACAIRCETLRASENACVPPKAPFSDSATYLSCFCQSAHLQSLRHSGDICSMWCTEEEGLIIYHKYNTICGSSQSSPSPPHSASPSAPTQDHHPLSSTSASPSAPTEDHHSSTTPPIASPEPHGIVNGEDRPSNPKGKYIAIAAVFVSMTVILALGLLLRYRHHKKQEKLRKQKANHGLVPLHLINEYAMSFSDLRSQPNSSLPTASSMNLNSLHRMEPASPLASPGSVQSFGDSLRFYEEDMREQAERRDRVAALLATPQPVRPRLQRYNDVAMRR